MRRGDTRRQSDSPGHSSAPSSPTSRPRLSADGTTSTSQQRYYGEGRLYSRVERRTSGSTIRQTSDRAKDSGGRSSAPASPSLSHTSGRHSTRSHRHAGDAPPSMSLPSSVARVGTRTTTWRNQSSTNTEAASSSQQPQPAASTTRSSSLTSVGQIARQTHNVAGSDGSDVKRDLRDKNQHSALPSGGDASARRDHFQPQSQSQPHSQSQSPVAQPPSHSHSHPHSRTHSSPAIQVGDADPSSDGGGRISNTSSGTSHAWVTAATLTPVPVSVTRPQRPPTSPRTVRKEFARETASKDIQLAELETELDDLRGFVSELTLDQTSFLRVVDQHFKSVESGLLNAAREIEELVARPNTIEPKAVIERVNGSLKSTVLSSLDMCHKGLEIVDIQTTKHAGRMHRYSEGAVAGARSPLARPPHGTMATTSEGVEVHISDSDRARIVNRALSEAMENQQRGAAAAAAAAGGVGVVVSGASRPHPHPEQLPTTLPDDAVLNRDGKEYVSKQLYDSLTADVDKTTTKMQELEMLLHKARADKDIMFAELSFCKRRLASTNSNNDNNNNNATRVASTTVLQPSTKENIGHILIEKSKVSQWEDSVVLRETECNERASKLVELDRTIAGKMKDVADRERRMDEQRASWEEKEARLLELEVELTAKNMEVSRLKAARPSERVHTGSPLPPSDLEAQLSAAQKALETKERQLDHALESAQDEHSRFLELEAALEVCGDELLKAEDTIRKLEGGRVADRSHLSSISPRASTHDGDTRSLFLDVARDSAQKKRSPFNPSALQVQQLESELENAKESLDVERGRYRAMVDELDKVKAALDRERSYRPRHLEHRHQQPPDHGHNSDSEWVDNRRGRKGSVYESDEERVQRRRRRSLSVGAQRRGLGSGSGSGGETPPPSIHVTTPRSRDSRPVGLPRPPHPRSEREGGRSGKEGLRERHVVLESSSSALAARVEKSRSEKVEDARHRSSSEDRHTQTIWGLTSLIGSIRMKNAEAIRGASVNELRSLLRSNTLLLEEIEAFVSQYEPGGGDSPTWSSDRVSSVGPDDARSIRRGRDMDLDRKESRSSPRVGKPAQHQHQQRHQHQQHQHQPTALPTATQREKKLEDMIMKADAVHAYKLDVVTMVIGLELMSRRECERHFSLTLSGNPRACARSALTLWMSFAVRSRLWEEKQKQKQALAVSDQIPAILAARVHQRSAADRDVESALRMYRQRPSGKKSLASAALVIFKEWERRWWRWCWGIWKEETVLVRCRKIAEELHVKDFDRLKAQIAKHNVDEKKWIGAASNMRQVMEEEVAGSKVVIRHALTICWRVYFQSLYHSWRRVSVANAVAVWQRCLHGSKTVRARLLAAQSVSRVAFKRLHKLVYVHSLREWRRGTDILTRRAMRLAVEDAETSAEEKVRGVMLMVEERERERDELVEQLRIPKMGLLSSICRHLESSVRKATIDQPFREWRNVFGSSELMCERTLEQSDSNLNVGKHVLKGSLLSAKESQMLSVRATSIEKAFRQSSLVNEELRLKVKEQQGALEAMDSELRKRLFEKEEAFLVGFAWRDKAIDVFKGYLSKSKLKESLWRWKEVQLRDMVVREKLLRDQVEEEKEVFRKRHSDWMVLAGDDTDELRRMVDFLDGEVETAKKELAVTKTELERARHGEKLSQETLRISKTQQKALLLGIFTSFVKRMDLEARLLVFIRWRMWTAREAVDLDRRLRQLAEEKEVVERKKSELAGLEVFQLEKVLDKERQRCTAAAAMVRDLKQEKADVSEVLLCRLTKSLELKKRCAWFHRWLRMVGMSGWKTRAKTLSRVDLSGTHVHVSQPLLSVGGAGGDESDPWQRLVKIAKNRSLHS